VIDDGEVQRALVIMAHPDDVDFGAAGTIAGWTDRGIEVTYAIVTDGDAGGFDRSVDRSRIASRAPRPPPSASPTSASSGTPTVRWK
jgi:LmbE family N-acetylglucosaminyl deacetylase